MALALLAWLGGQEGRLLFSCKNFWNFDTVLLSFVFGNYYPIMN